MKFWVAVLSPVFACMSANASHANPVGNWRCVVDDPSVSIDVNYQVGPSGSLSGSGTIIYKENLRPFAVEAQGTWSSAPADDGSGATSYRFQLFPSNHAVFSVFPLETRDPNVMYRVFNNPQTGLPTETACNRLN
jgi:hypothetical protein